MKRFSLLIAIVCCLTLSLQAQRGEPQGQRWWTGAHTAIGFGASTNLINYTFGLAPMYGYRIIPQISVGPRASILYNHYRFRDDFGNPFLKFNLVDLGLGAFVRGQVYRQYFAQVELMYESVQVPFNNGDKITYNGMNAYIGIGMNSGGNNPSFELMLAYDLNLQAIYRNNLINGRFGFTLFY
jgi:hypothetical protein